MFDDKLGCKKCNASPEPKTSRSTLPYEITRSLYESSHYAFWLCECRYCGTPWLEYFKEFIGWLDGDDKMYTSWMPLVEFELAEISRNFPQERGRESIPELQKYFGRRRTLVLDPKNSYHWDQPGINPLHLAVTGSP